MDQRLQIVNRLVTVGLITAATALVVGQQNRQPAPGARVLIVALRDSHLLTVCPVAGKDLIVSDASNTSQTLKWRGDLPAPVKGKATVDLAHDRLIVTILDRAWLRAAGARHASAALPLSSSWHLQASGQPTERIPQTTGVTEFDRIAADPAVQMRVEDGFRKWKRYIVADNVESADYVFLVESRYIVRGVAESQGATYASIGGDRPANWRESVLALAVPAEVYRRSAADAAALCAARIWEGFSLTESVPVGSALKSVSASPDVLVDEFNTRWHAPLESLPLCAGPSPSKLEMMPAVSKETAVGSTAAAQRPPQRVPQPTFRSQVTLVVVPFTATDDSGRAILDLKPSELHLFEDGVEQRIDRLLPSTASTRIAVLLDSSGSMWSHRADVRSAAASLIDMVKPSDRLLLASFDDSIRLLADFSNNSAALKRDLPADISRREGAGTRLYDAIDLLLDERFRGLEGRAAMVLVTDGIDTRSRLVDAADVASSVEGSNVAVYVVRYDSSGAKTFRMPNAIIGARALLVPDDAVDSGAVRDAVGRYLLHLSTTTGGRMYSAASGEDLHEVFKGIVDELSQQYVVSYYPTNEQRDGHYRQIRVSTDRPAAKVRARQGYRL
jgi:VWFA-related protein